MKFIKAVYNNRQTTENTQRNQDHDDKIQNKTIGPHRTLQRNDINDYKNPTLDIIIITILLINKDALYQELPWVYITSDVPCSLLFSILISQILVVSRSTWPRFLCFTKFTSFYSVTLLFGLVICARICTYLADLVTLLTKTVGQ